MSGRHRKPTKTTLRLARVGALTVLAAAPLAFTGSALASPTTHDPGSPRLSERDDSDSGSDWDDDRGAQAASTSDDDELAHWDDRDGYGSGHLGGSRRAIEAEEYADDATRSGSVDDEPSARSAATATHRATTRRADQVDKTDQVDETTRRAARSSTSATARQAAQTSTAQTGARDARWDRLAQCESTQNWDANTGNGYKGGLQFTDSTWRAYGGHAYATSANQASRAEQIAVAKKVQQAQGWGAWPSCSRKLGYA